MLKHKKTVTLGVTKTSINMTLYFNNLESLYSNIPHKLVWKP